MIIVGRSVWLLADEWRSDLTLEDFERVKWFTHVTAGYFGFVILFYSVRILYGMCVCVCDRKV